MIFGKLVRQCPKMTMKSGPFTGGLVLLDEMRFILKYNTLNCIFFKKYLFIYLAASGLSCGAGSSLRCAVFSLVVACGFSLSSCGARAPGHVGFVVCGTRAL